MKKITHEIRDPIHVFIKLDTTERKVLDSQPLQRLRYIHQLAMTYLIYPGATHKRFEHSLGVMELASRVFDIITDPHYVLSSGIIKMHRNFHFFLGLSSISLNVTGQGLWYIGGARAVTRRRMKTDTNDLRRI